MLVLREAAVTVENVEVQKDCACLELEGREHTIRASVTQPRRKEIRTWVAARRGAR